MEKNKKRKLLVVDDEAALRDAIAFDFKRRGYDVFTAGNGTEAFELVRQFPFDVILTDVRMPGGNGVELLKQVKDLNARLPVVMFITGFSDLTVEEAYDLGADAVFSKPFDRKALISAVEKVCVDIEDGGSFRFDRVLLALSIELRLPSRGFVSAHSLNIGRGGVFVMLEKSLLPEVGQELEFKLCLQDERPLCIEGIGLVRWVRTEESQGRPVGCGLEFTALTQDGKAAICGLINAVKTKAFIPLQ